MLIEAARDAERCHDTYLAAKFQRIASARETIIAGTRPQLRWTMCSQSAWFASERARSTLEQVKRIAHRHDAKVNDVPLVAAAGGGRTLLASLGESV